jgi:hypothetical protein
MKKIISTLCISLVFLSCSKNFIETRPISSVSVDVLYKTDKDYQDAVIGCYRTLQNQYQNFWEFGDLRGDDVEEQWTAALDLMRIDNFTADNSETVIASSWQNYYNIINRANTVLEKIKDADSLVVKNKSRHTGEAEFLRAMAYFDLVRIFGDVPMLTTPVSSDDALKKGRDKVNDIYDQVIIKDLLDAANRLPAKYSGADVGRVTKGAAKAMLGRVYLTRKDFVKAEAVLLEVTQMGYVLLPKYTDLFDYTKDEHHSEYIFDIEYEEGIGLGSIFTSNFCPFVAPIMSFYGVTGSTGNHGSPSAKLFAAFPAGDLRKDITVATGVTDKDGVFTPLPVGFGMQAFTRKYMTPMKTSNDSRANWKVIRYADVLLMYAEALNENGKTPDAVTYLNMVHTRAGLTGYDDTMSESDTRENIYLERRLELSYEGVRWFDLIRTDRALDTMQSTGMKTYMTVFPLPLGQIQIVNNPTIFPQNQGYN